MACRIISLLPSATEIICALGAGGDLVGISHECDHPPEVRRLPRVTRSRLTAPVTSAAIHAEITDLVARALAVYEVDTLALAALRPDLIVTQDLCRVCAVSYDALLTATRRTIARHATIVNLHPTRLDEIFDDVIQIAKAIDRTEASTALIAGLRVRIEAVRSRTERARNHPRVLAIEWLEPVMLGGLWMAELITLAGGEPLGPAAGYPAMTLGRTELARLEPNFVLIKPCGYTLAETKNELERLPVVLPLEAWSKLPEGRIALCDGSAYFNRPGPRIVDSLELLATLLHPELFPEHSGLARSATLQVRPPANLQK